MFISLAHRSEKQTMLKLNLRDKENSLKASKFSIYLGYSNVRWRATVLKMA